jgi:hypothetical protein
LLASARLGEEEKTMGGSSPTLATAANRRWLTWAALVFLAAFVALGTITGITGDPASLRTHPTTTTTRLALHSRAAPIHWGWLLDHDPRQGP